MNPTMNGQIFGVPFPDAFANQQQQQYPVMQQSQQQQYPVMHQQYMPIQQQQQQQPQMPFGQYQKVFSKLHIVFVIPISKLFISFLQNFRQNCSPSTYYYGGPPPTQNVRLHLLIDYS